MVYLYFVAVALWALPSLYASRHGMLVSNIGLFMIPMLYVVFQRMREGPHRWWGK
jgi:hypothetical protein